MSYSFLTQFSIFFIFTLIGLLEYYKLIALQGVKSQKILGVIFGITTYSLLSLFFYDIIELKYVFFVIAFLYIIFLQELFKKAPNPFNNIAHTLLGIFYVAVPFSILSYLAAYESKSINHIEYQPQILLGFIFCVWLSDTGAYVFGSLFGKTKLFPAVSPNKSWEGTLGGALVATSFAIAYYHYTNTLSLTDWIVIALIVVVFGNFGDLIESYLKRSVNVKDSGTLLPGHGGVLDRFDAVIFASPFVFFYLNLIS
jgi:phosphatidate cytidylyltransferase